MKDKDIQFLIEKAKEYSTRNVVRKNIYGLTEVDKKLYGVLLAFIYWVKEVK